MPEKMTGFRIFPGLAGYYRWLIMWFSDSPAVLQVALSVKKAFEWTLEMHEAFQYLKEKLNTPLVLAFQDFDSLS